MTEGPAKAEIVPASVNELPRTDVDGTQVVTDIDVRRPATVLAPVKRTLRSAMRVVKAGRR